MFTAHVRKVALAFAGAVVVASTLLTSAAAAAPKPPGTPINDVQVTILERSGSGQRGERGYARFEVKNVGDQQMTFTLRSAWSKQNPFTDQYFPTTVDQVMTLNPGDAKPIELHCDPKNSNFRCYTYIVLAFNFDKTDANINNNGAQWTP
jgi:hypothetical protein